MMLSPEDLGCSCVMEAYLNDSFLFLSRSMVRCWEDVGGSSWLKADLDDIFTFVSRFTGGLDLCYDDILGRFWISLSDAS